MRTTYTSQFEKSFMHGLAGVGKRRTRKQILKDIVTSAFSSIDMAKGLQGKNDWRGSAAKLVNAAGLMDQAIDLAETLPGVRFEKTRQQAQLVVSRLNEAQKVIDTEPAKTRELIKACEDALTKSIMVVDDFASGLNDEPVLKESDPIDFCEKSIISSVSKVMLSRRSGMQAQADARRQRIGERVGIFKPAGAPSAEASPHNTSWHAAPEAPGKQRKWNPTSEKYEYRPITAAASSATVSAEKPAGKADIDKTGKGKKGKAPLKGGKVVIAIKPKKGKVCKKAAAKNKNSKLVAKSFESELDRVMKQI